MNGSIAAETADPAGNGEDPVLEESHLQREALARGAGGVASRRRSACAGSGCSDGLRMH